MRSGDSELFKDKVEVSLDGRQIFYLFFGGAVIACLVFVLGVMVGKRVEARSHVHAQAQTSAVEDPLAALDKLSADEGSLAFPEALRGDADKPLGPVDELLATPTETSDEERASASAAKVVAKAEVKADKKPDPAPKPEAKPEPAKPEAKPEPAKPEKKAASASKKHWTLQLSSFQERAEADSFHAKLVDAGYQPYIVEAQVPGKGTWYRVRLGSYPGYDAAIAAKKRFESKQKIIAYVTRVKGRR